MTRSDLIIEIDHVTFGYDASRTILNDVSLTFERGKVTAILGGSGCGKTTLLRLIGGVYPVNAGTVRFDGQVVDAADKEALFKLRRRLGMLFQFGALFTDLSVFENVAFPLREHTKLRDKEIRARVIDKLKILGLVNVENRFPSQLSGGMRKRVGLARALMLEPEVLMYDEPTSGLDPITCRMVDELIVETRERFGVTSIVISHDMAGALRIADYIYLLHKGEIAARGTPLELVEGDSALAQEFFESSGIAADKLVALGHGHDTEPRG